MDSQSGWLQRDEVHVTKQCEDRRTFDCRQGLGCTGNGSKAHLALVGSQNVRVAGNYQRALEGRLQVGNAFLDRAEEACQVSV